MNYWLICLPRADLDHCIKIGTFGLSRKHIIGDIKKGDKVVCCAAKGDWKFVAAGEATSDYYIDDSAVFLKEGTFPDRFDFNAERFAEELDLMQVIDQLSFVTNLAFWAVYFRNGIAKLTKADWELIMTQFQKRQRVRS